MRIPDSIFIFALISTAVSPCFGSVVYNESVFGDLSNSGLSPTFISVASGSNQILGNTGNLDRDYFKITVPVNFKLTSIKVQPGTAAGGEFSFIGLQAGNQVTVAKNPTSAAGLLGWWHYSDGDIGTDILSQMSVPSFGSTGFTAPLGSGNYAFWIQDFDLGLSPYRFDINISQVPLPSAYLGFLFGMGFLGMARNRCAVKSSDKSRKVYS